MYSALFAGTQTLTRSSKQADEESNEPAPAEKSARPVPSEDKGAGDKKEVRGKAKQGARSEAGVQRKRT